MRHVKLTDGTVYPVDLCGAAPDRLIINVTEGDLPDLVLKFGTEENVVRIEHYYDDTNTDHRFFEGFTALISVTITDTGVMLTLKKEEN